MNSTAAVGERESRTPQRLVSLSHARRSALAFGCLLLLGPLPLYAQEGGTHGGAGQTGAMTSQPPDPFGMSDPSLQKRLELARDKDRQKQLVEDTQKLFALAQQLRDEVAKTKSDQLSVDVVKTTAQIEKLAKSVNEKMRGY